MAARISERAVRKSLAELEKMGLIKRTKRLGALGRTSDLITMTPLLLAGRSEMPGTVVGTPRGGKRLRTQAEKAAKTVGVCTTPAAAAAETPRQDLPDPSGSSCRQIPSREQDRENPAVAREDDHPDMGGTVSAEKQSVLPTALVTIGELPLPGDPLPGAVDRIADLMVEIGAEIGPAFDGESDGILNARALADFVLRHPNANLGAELITLARYWTQKGLEPIRSWSVVGAILERGLERYPHLRDNSVPDELRSVRRDAGLRADPRSDELQGWNG